MSNFEPLKVALAMDFTQMRAKKQREINCATDEAIKLFVSCFRDFFAQFASRPSEAELQEYKQIMDRITNKINDAELAYFTKKYTDESKYSTDEVSHMTSFHALKGYQGIPTRMQYWAAGEQYGGTIRNAEMHANVVHQMDKWVLWVNSPVRAPQTMLSFDDSETDLDEEPSNDPVRKLSFI